MFSNCRCSLASRCMSPAVTAEDVKSLANEHLKLENMYLAAVGPKELDLGKYLAAS